MTAHDPRVTLTDLLAAHARLPMMHSQGCSCGWHASLSHPDLHRAHLAERIEEHIAARLAPIRALADKWEGAEDAACCQECQTGVYVRQNCGEDLRAALDAPVSASQDHDGAEGQGEGERAGEGGFCDPAWCNHEPVHNHPPYRPPCNERLVDGLLRGACLNDDGSPR